MKNPYIYKKLILFPLLFIYLELILHASIGLSIKYLPIYLAFCISYGAIVTAIVGLFGNKNYYTVTKVFVGLITVLYTAEYYAKVILQTFYPFSILTTAAENHLDEFRDVVIGTIFKKFYVLIIFFIPFILCMVFMKKKRVRSSNIKTGRAERKRLKSSAVVIISLGLAIITFLMGMFIVLVIPSKADVTPKMLYLSDTNFDDQVEQLGLMTMLRLDIKHMIFPAQGGEFTGPEIVDEPLPEAKYNVMDFDFDAMLANASNKNYEWLTQYTSSNIPTKQNDYTGKFEGYNVVILCLEGFSGYGISEEYTPTLYKLSHEGFVFNNFYTALHYTSTSNGECQLLLGLYPKGGNPITMKRSGEVKLNAYFSLAQQLGRLGYRNVGFHNNQWNLYGREESHTNLGYDWYGGHMLKKAGFILEKKPNGKESDPYGYYWPQKDSYMIDKSVPIYNDTETPFNVYYMTISGHIPGATYVWNHSNAEYKELLSTTSYSEGTQAYIGTCMEVDKAVEHLIESLREAGTLDKTIIVACPDHIPYGCVDVLEELAEKEFGTSEALSAINEASIDFDVYKSSLIIWNNKMALTEEPVIVDKVCCQVDVLPTLSNLLGLEYDSRMISGSDILSDSEGLVVFSSRSWKSDKGFYNRFTQTFTPTEGVTMTEDEIASYVDTMKAIVANKLDATNRIVESNFYNYAIQYLKPKEEPTEAN